jgi:Flp pilus assembly protein TadG
MNASLEWLSRSARQFGRSRSGNVAMLFAISVVPITIAIGATMDYTRLATIRTKLNSAADIATLASVSKDSQPFVTTPTQASVQKIFNQAAGAVSGATITSFQATITPSVTNLTVRVDYTASAPVVFGAFLGHTSQSVSGTSTASVNAPPYVNFYLLLDNSPSMGLGATPADISQLETLTGGCAFACHQHTFDGQGHITGDNTGDNYHIAKQNNVTVRIDVERTATQQLTQTAASTETISNQFAMAVYTFSDTFQTIAPLSTSMTTVAANASAIDLAYAYYNQRDAQTDFNTALTHINSIMPNPGDGSSSSSPKEFLFLVTDGVSDMPVGTVSGSGDPPDTPLSYQPPGTQPNVSNSLPGNVSRGYCPNGSNCDLIDVIKSDPQDPNSLCTIIKNRNIIIAVLYTPYQPVTNNTFYNQWVGATNDTVANNNPVNATDPTDPQSNGPGVALKACASPGFYFQVTPSLGISAAMQALFAHAVQSVMLTH